MYRQGYGVYYLQKNAAASSATTTILNELLLYIFNALFLSFSFLFLPVLLRRLTFLASSAQRASGEPIKNENLFIISR